MKFLEDVTKSKISFTIAECVEATGLSTVTLHKLFNEGLLTRHKIGRRTYVMADELQAFFRSRAVPVGTGQTDHSRDGGE